MFRYLDNRYYIKVFYFSHSTGERVWRSSSDDGSVVGASVCGVGRPTSGALVDAGAFFVFPNGVFSTVSFSLACALLATFGALLGVRGVAFVRFFRGLGGASVGSLVYGCAFSEAVLGTGGFSAMRRF